MGKSTTTDTPHGTEVLNPGDEAAPGTPGTGEDVCPVCRGSGRRDGRACANCGGTGKIIEGVGGA
jgi:hypothetical protein